MSGSKVTAEHRRRDAYVYVRQSTVMQVREHTESLQRQYELAGRAVDLGWSSARVVVIDEDLGRSGAETSARTGFQRLVADVGLGQVGLILGIEVSRLARNNADWYQLLDLCAVTDTLIADGDGLYHAGDFNDRLVLGLKGTMSEAELHLIRGRLTAGLRHKAAKGELRQGLPVGYDYDEADTVVLCADEAVVESIAVVFRRFDELGSGRQVLLSLIEDGLQLPRRTSTRARVRWAKPTYGAVHDFLTNPCYAGAFVFGRTATAKRVDADGRLLTRTRQVARDEWEVCIPEHHSGFVTWERYEQIQDELRANYRPRRDTGGGGAVREGTALLQGRIRCGRCGRMMRTGYSGAKGDCPRYVCAHAKALYGTATTCQSIGGRRLEQRVCDEVFAVLAPAALAATAKALAEAESHHAARLKTFELAVERAGYEAQRARRQFDAVEPENRLVARTVEAVWEQRLTDQRRAEADLAAQRAHRPSVLTADELAWLRRAGADVRRVFDAPATTPRERKQLLRTILTEVVLTVDSTARTAGIVIVWQGGATTQLTMTLNKTGGHFRTTDEDTVALVGRLAAHYDDRTIAGILGRQHRRTGTGLEFTQSRVKSLRVSRGIPAFTAPVAPSDDDAPVFTVKAAGRELGVDHGTIYRWLRTGFLAGQQITPGAPWQIRIDQAVRDRIVPQTPHGWLPLEQAAVALGVSRQTVLHQVQRGELDAVYLNHGKRKGLRINVIDEPTGLFDQPR